MYYLVFCYSTLIAFRLIGFTLFIHLFSAMGTRLDGKLTIECSRCFLVKGLFHVFFLLQSKRNDFFLDFIVLVQKLNVNYCFITVNSFEVLIEDNEKETCYDI